MVSQSDANRFRQGALKISQLAKNDLATVAARLDLNRPELTRDILLEAVPEISTRYTGMGGALAVEQYALQRELAGVSGLYTPVSADLPTIDLVQDKVRWAAGSLFVEDPAMPVGALNWTLQALIMGTIANTTLLNVEDDPQGVGWQRIARATGCDFCIMLTGRGGVYRTEKSASFAAHEHCSCTAVPSWDPTAPEVPARCYEASKRMESVRRRAAGAATDDDIRNARRAAGKKWSGNVTTPERLRDQKIAQRILDDHRARTKIYLQSIGPEIEDYRQTLSKAQGVKLAEKTNAGKSVRPNPSTKAAPKGPLTAAGGAGGRKPPKNSAIVAGFPDDDRRFPKKSGTGTVTIPEGLDIEPHEVSTGISLSRLGHSVRFRTIDYSEGAKNPDIVLDEKEIWEFKAPKGSSKNSTIDSQFKRGKKQAKNLVIDLARCGLDDDFATNQIIRRFYGQMSIEKVIIIDKTGAATYLHL